MATTADLRNGLCIFIKNGIYSVVEFQHTKPGKGHAFVRTKLKNIKTGRTIENTFSAGHKIITARIEKRTHQFLYKDEIGYHFMDKESFEQIFLDESFLIDLSMIKEGEEVSILFHVEDNKVVGCQLPPSVNLKVIYTEPGVKGDTAINATKPAILETNMEIQVPLFIQQNDIIKIDTHKKTYIERIKKSNF